MKNKNIKLLTKFSLVVLMMSPVSTVISAKTSSDYGNAVVMAPTATDKNKDGNNSQITTSDDSSTDSSKSNGTVVSDTPNTDSSTKNKNADSKKKITPNVDAPTADSYTNDDPNVDDQRGLAKWANYKGPLASSMSHIYKGVPIASAKAKKGTADYSYFQLLLKFNFVNFKGQMDTGIAKKFNYNVDTGIIKKAIANVNDPIKVTQAGKAEDNAKLETVYTPADKTKDPWGGGILKFTYTNKVNAVADYVNESNLMSEVVHGLGFGAVIQLPENVTYDQIVKGFQNGELQVATGPGEGTGTWYGSVTSDTLAKIGQEKADYNRWQLKDSSKYFEAVPGDKHKMYFSLHRFLDETVADPKNLNEKDNPITYSFLQYILTAIVNHMTVPGGMDPSNPSNFYNIPITFSTEINLGEAIPDGVIGADDEFKTSDTDEDLVTSMTKNKLPASPTGTIDMGVQFYGIEQLDTSNSDDWEIKAGQTAYEAPMKQKTWTNFIKPVDPSTGKILQYDATKNAYVYDGQISKSSGSKKLSDFAKVWNLYKNKLATSPQAVKTNKSLSELNKGSDTVTYYTDESDATDNLSPVKIYFSNVVEEAVNHKPVVKDVKLDPVTMVEKSEKDIAVSGKYSDEDTDDKISLEYQIDDGPLKDVDAYQNVSKKQMKAMAAKYEKKLKKQQAKAAKEIAAHKKDEAAKPSVVKKNKILTNNINNGIQQPSLGENDSLIIADNGGQITYSISTEKTGNPTQTAVGDEVTVHTRVSADAPQNTKINEQDVYIKQLNSAFIFPYEYENGANGKPMLEEMNNGDGVAGLYSSDGKQKATIKTWKYGDGSFDDTTMMALKYLWQLGVGAIPGYSIKGTTTYENYGNEEVYNDKSFKADGNQINYPNPGQSGATTNTVNGVPTTAAYVTFKNKMTKGDYLEFTYKYKVGEGADGELPDKIKFYAGTGDYAAVNTTGIAFSNYISTKLVGDVINSIGINPDQTEYDAEVTQANLSSYSQAMTGTYTDTSGTTPTIQYEVNSSNEKPSSNAKAATVDGTKKTYSANVTSGNWKFGVNTVRFFLTGKDGKVTYADVTVNLSEKIDPDKDFNFTIPASEIKELDNKEVGKHTVHVYAVDDKGAKSDDVKDVSTGDFEVTPIPNTAPVIDTLTNEKGELAGPTTKGSDLKLKLGWHDAESQSFTASYHIYKSSDIHYENEVASGDIDPSLLKNPEPGKSNETAFTIPGTVTDKLEVGTQYNIVVDLTDDGKLSDNTRGEVYQTAVVAANEAPKVNKITNDSGMEATQNLEVGTPLSLHLKWTDADSNSFTAKYNIKELGGTSSDPVVTGDIDPKSLINKPGTENNTDFVIPGADTAKLIPGKKYAVSVILTDDGGATDNSEKVLHYIFSVVEPKPDLELPDKLSFKEVTVGSTRQLDLRDTGWDQVKNNGGLDVTVQQTTPWVVEGSASTLSPIEMVSSDDEFNNHRGTPIDTAAVPVKFKSDGTLDWSDQFGLLQPIGTDNLAGSYSTELTWTTTDAPK